jgi:predicted alpha/beta-hydrolase family hydrolase
LAFDMKRTRRQATAEIVEDRRAERPSDRSIFLLIHDPIVSEVSFAFDVGGARASALVYPSERAAPHAALVLAHGAGAPQTHPWMVGMARALASRGLDVVTFNFLYADAKRRVPDKNAVLEDTWLAALEAVRTRADVAHARLFIGGKSMGGRIATQVAAQGAPGIEGVVLLGYPLHPPGRPEKLRAAHLERVKAPMLFVQGSRDAFGTPEELEPFLAPLAERGTRLFVVQGGDHSLVPLKSGGLDRAQVIDRVADEIARFTA